MFNRDIEEIPCTIEAGHYAARINLVENVKCILFPVAAPDLSEERESNSPKPALELRSTDRTIRPGASVTTQQNSPVIRRLMLEHNYANDRDFGMPGINRILPLETAKANSPSVNSQFKKIRADSKHATVQPPKQSAALNRSAKHTVVVDLTEADEIIDLTI